MVEQADISEMIDLKSQKWDQWGSMLRRHPDMFVKIIDRLPSATCEIDSLSKTAAIFRWLKVLGVELIDLGAYEHFEENPFDTISFYIAFKDSPYNTHPEMPGIGRNYVDRDFGKIIKDKAIAEISSYLLQKEENHFILPWLQTIEKAEHAYFNEDPLAPVCTLEWFVEYSSVNPLKRDPTLKWDATREILNISAGQRRFITGHRKNKPFPSNLRESAPQKVLDYAYDFDLDLAIHIPSDLLITKRNARLLSERTGLVDDVPTIRRTI